MMNVDLPTNGDTGSVGPPPPPRNCVYTSCYCEENIYLLAQALCAEADRPAPPRWTRLWDIHVVFVSNEGKTVALWHQKARDDVVVWDYHVILVLRPRRAGGHLASNGEIPGAQPVMGCWVYDYDSRLPMPCSWREYMSTTFPYVSSHFLYDIPENFVSVFRVVPAREYLDYFVSDRSHMLVDGETGMYSSPPPVYPPLCGSKAKELKTASNLMEGFVSMRLGVVGATAVAETTGDTAEEVTPHVPRTQPAVYGEVMDMAAFLSWLSAVP